MVSACAVAALAMVFSVQQGEHGPLVVYKLTKPEPGGDVAAPAPGALPAAIAPARKLSPLQPTPLGTVTLPAPEQQAHSQGAITTYELPAELPAGLPAEPAPAPTLLDVQAFGEVYREALAAGAQEDLVNRETGEPVTLQEINDAVVWRRDTAKKLKRPSFAPRF